MKGYKLIPDDLAKFNFGTHSGVISEFFSSDKLFSAIINNLSLIYSNEVVEKVINTFSSSQSISSLCYGLDIIDNKTGVKKRTLYFLPKPKAVIMPINVKERDLSSIKGSKKVNWVSLAAFQEIIDNWDPDTSSINYNFSRLTLIGNKFACLSDEIQELNISATELNDLNFINMDSRPRLKMERFTDESIDYYDQEEMEVRQQKTDNYYFLPFMYFLLKGENCKEFDAAIRLIPDEGLGGKRSLGMGVFNSIEEFDCSDFLAQNENGSYYISLSCVYPQKTEVNELISYELDNRNGYVYSGAGRSYRKKSIRVIKEGSVFKRKIEGQVADITPEAFGKHRIYLNGKAFTIPIGRGNS
ncbi:MAG: type III-A CRISPR-associated RAMP protein Csm4 [Peptococcales bacterium]|jgi:CRISPR-associated protein Csm4